MTKSHMKRVSIEWRDRDHHKHSCRRANSEKNVFFTVSEKAFIFSFQKNCQAEICTLQGSISKKANQHRESADLIFSLLIVQSNVLVSILCVEAQVESLYIYVTGQTHKRAAKSATTKLVVANPKQNAEATPNVANTIC